MGPMVLCLIQGPAVARMGLERWESADVQSAAASRARRAEVSGGEHPAQASEA